MRCSSNWSWLDPASERPDMAQWTEYLLSCIMLVTFPEHELPDYRSHLKSHGWISTHRTSREYKKYRVGEVYHNDALGDLMCVFVADMLNLDFRAPHAGGFSRRTRRNSKAT